MSTLNYTFSNHNDWFWLWPIFEKKYENKVSNQECYITLLKIYKEMHKKAKQSLTMIFLYKHSHSSTPLSGQDSTVHDKVYSLCLIIINYTVLWFYFFQLQCDCVLHQLKILTKVTVMRIMSNEFAKLYLICIT